MLRSILRCGALVGTLGLAACDLEVLNENQPSREQIKTQVADLENFLGTQYRRWHSALYGVTGNVWGMANVMSFENFSTLSNNCQGQRVGIPRPPNDNQVGNVCDGEQALVYNRMSEVARGMADVLRRMNESGFTFGTAGQDARNRAFAEFLRGVSMGYLAMVYDSAAAVSAADEVVGGTAVAEELAHYTVVLDSAFVALQNALDASPGMMAVPPTWLASAAGAMAEPEFVRLVRSYRARLRANVARTPAERDAVDWNAVIDDALNGITADHRVVTNTVTGPTMTWVSQWYAYTTWHQMTPFIVGMGDVSGSYAVWISEPLDTRGSDAKFFMITPDLRFPQGATRAEQQADFTLAGDGTEENPGCSGPGQTCERYFRNRDVADPPASPNWGGSQYDHVRFYSWRTAGSGGTGNNGPFPFFTKAELDLLAAEGYIRIDNPAAALPLVNNTRTANGGLPALVSADTVTAVPGGAAGCVPKRPVNAGHGGGGTVTCGTLWDALKWEKRIETAYTHFAAWFLDGRGWGDLPQGTPLDWAPPFQELQARFRVGSQIYTPTATAGVSSYGW
ncbi:MAG TPA: hypothetical protein VFO95_03910 [Gemmatimonadales bacterium]|nr:hypothetical protein [Gemmatimonadales bacterium]